jgi:hypothetical protein
VKFEQKNFFKKYRGFGKLETSLTQMGREDVKLIVAQDRVQWWALKNTEMSIRGP